MSYKKERRPMLFARSVEFQEGIALSTAEAATSTGSFVVEEIQALTGASTATTINNYGITTIVVTTGQSTAANIVFTIANPTKGRRKTILADLNSTKEVSVRTVSSAAGSNFFGTTKNSFTFSTGSTYAPSSVELLGLSTAQWAILDIRTPLAQSTAVNDWNVTIAGATA